MKFHRWVGIGLLLIGLVVVADSFSRDLNQRAWQHRIQVLQQNQVMRSGSQPFQGTFRPGFQTGQSVVLTTPGSIAGKVFGLDEKAIAGAYVEAFYADSVSGDYGFSKGLAFVAPDGSYQIDSLAVGAYYVFAWADGYVLKYYPDALDLTRATRVEVRSGAITTGIDFNMEKIVPGTGSISGKVQMESDRTPIERAQVSAFSPDNPYLYGWAETDKDGNYVITGLKSGPYFVSVWADGFLTEYYDNTQDFEKAQVVQVSEPNETKAIDFVLTRGGIISGLVLADDSTPVVGAYLLAMQVYFDSTATDSTKLDSMLFNYYGKAMSDENGKYIITGLPPGQYFIRAEVWSRWSYSVEWYQDANSWTEATAIPVQADSEITGIDFKLEYLMASGSIKGLVTDTQGIPIANAYVQAQSVDQGSTRPMIWASATTDSNGYYQLQELPNDSYYVSVWAQSGWQYVQRWWPDAETIENAQAVTLGNGTTPETIDFRLPLVRGSAVIAGYVKSREGKFISGANVYVSPARQDVYSLWAYGYSDSTGYYKIENLPAGTYIASCFAWDFDRFGQQWYNQADSLAAATPIVLTERERRTDIHFTLDLKPMFGSVAGTVIDSLTGLPMPRALIQITAQYQDWTSLRPYYNWSYNAVSDENGKFRLDGLWRGTYMVAVYSDGAMQYYDNACVAEWAKLIEVVGGEITEVKLDLVPRNDGTGVITGTVLSEWDQTPFEIAVITARPAITAAVYPQSELFYTAVTQKDGSYALKGLPPGEYYVMSFAPYTMPKFYDGVYDPAQATLVTVDGSQPTSEINFNLSYIYWLKDNSRWLEGGNGTMIMGKVTDSNSRPVAGANVYLLNSAGQPMGAVQTNSEGIYQLAGMPMGNYVLQVSKVGYATTFNGNASGYEQATPLQVGNGITELDFQLSPQNPTKVPGTSNWVLPRQVELYGNYPNPFNPSTQIAFALPKAALVKLNVYNIAGEKVASIFDGSLPAGKHQLSWDGKNTDGQTIPSGVYIYRLNAGPVTLTGKMILLR